MATRPMAPPPPVAPAATPTPVPPAAPPTMAPSPPVPAAAPPPRALQATVPHWAPPAAAPPAVAPSALAPPAPWLEAEASMLGAKIYSKHIDRVPLISSTGDLVPEGMAFHKEKIDKMEYFYTNSRDFAYLENNGATFQESAGTVVEDSVSTWSRLGIKENVHLANQMIPTEDLSSYPTAKWMIGSLQRGLYSIPHIDPLSQLGTNMSGFYQQLMRDASVGALMQVNDGLCGNADVENQFPPEECYYAGAESDDGTAGYISDDNMEELQKMDSTKDDSTFTDPASKEDLNFGRDLDYEYVDRGIDDTVLETETEVEAELDGQNSSIDIDQGAELLQGDVAHDVLGSKVNNDNITPSVLGDCGYAQEISERYLDDVAAGFKKRHRSSAEGVTADCREPRDMGALEIAMRTSSNKKPGEPICEPILGMVFDSKEEAYEFYNMYAWEVGFSIIYNCSRKRTNGERSKQELTCQKAGRDRRVQNATRKEKCRARIVLLRNGDGGWYISNIVKDHNHPLAESCCEKRELHSHKRLLPNQLEMIRHLRQINIGQTQVRCIVGGMHGSLKDAPTKRTLRAVCSQIKREQMDNDVGKTIEIFKQMRAKDPDFQWSVERGSDNTINTLMWCTGKSREQYECFGDVVTFDTTYCTNFYKMPFGLFVGVNNHFQTIVFAGVLMRQETIESFKWVFNEFLALMGGKAPQTVLTDQCKSMTIALAEVWQSSFHLWCKWHVLKRIREFLGPLYTKNAVFREEFYAIVNEMLTKEEFVRSWKDLCTRYDITENPFMVRTFQCRSKWAKPWSEGHYCAGMTSTQRSESANMMLKKFVPRNSSMNVFVSQYNLLLEDRDLEEGRQENITAQVMVKKGRMWPFERHALKIYTRASFNLFRKQVDKAANFVIDSEGEGFYVIKHNYREKMPEWKRTIFRVDVIEKRKRYHCECGLYEHLGILCCHTLRILIHEDVSEIPKAHIMKRWTREAKDMVPNHRKEHQPPLRNMNATSLKRLKLNNMALEAITKGNTDDVTQEVVIKHLSAAIKEVDDILLARANKSKMAAANEIGMQSNINGVQSNQYGAAGSSAEMSDTDIMTLKAPLVHKTSGCPRRKRFQSGADIAIKKTKGKRKRTKASSQINDINMLDEGIEPLEISPGLPYQSTFCTKCKKTGHNKKNCVAKSKRARRVTSEGEDFSESAGICTKCGLKGHDEKECLVAEDDSNSFFK